MAEPLLRADGLHRRFGGLAAVAGIDLAVEEGEIHAVIGPNGAGKTTLLSLLAGSLAPSAGRVGFRGRDVTALPAWRRARLGIARSFQRTNIFPGLTVAENCWIAAQARLPHSLGLWRPARRHRRIADLADQALALSGLGPAADRPAARLSHGEQRQLEFGMILAGEPSLLLLDEPMAGMAGEETARVVALLRELRRGRTIVLIEHDMDAVFALADRITVMVEGRLLETASPAAIRASPAVRAAYLGEEAP